MLKCRLLLGLVAILQSSYYLYVNTHMTGIPLVEVLGHMLKCILYPFLILSLACMYVFWVILKLDVIKFPMELDKSTNS